ncbi:MAG: zinc-binding dehydrogenase [Rhizobiales bacterium]|nr:zinc-binding dehydrogenase [Hyphomicrobiales bacterium]
MKAVQLSRFGAPDVLDIIDIPAPVAGPGQALIRVRAAGVNFFEVLMRADRYAVTPDLPMMLGVEVAGVVEALGDGAALPIGARVAIPLFAAGRAGGYADYVAVEAASAVPLPEGLSFDDACALMVQGLTALHLVQRSRPEGKTVQVTAAAGGVGSLLVQLAKRAGARRVIAAASSPAKRDLALALGADAAIAPGGAGWAAALGEATGKAGLDIVYDFVGGALTSACLDELAPGGELVFGALGRLDLDTARLETVFARNQSLRGFALLPLLTPTNLRPDLEELFTLAADGALQVVKGGGYPLGAVAEAHRAMESRATTGKVVLVP